MIPLRPSSLEALRIASPCTASWEAMKGDAKRRYCGDCRLFVHDVSQMTTGETQALLSSSGGRACLRLWRRADGRVLTKDCGPLRERLVRRLRWIRGVAAGLFAFLGLGGCSREEAPPAGTPADSAPALPEELPPMGKVCAPEPGDVSRPTTGLVAPPRPESDPTDVPPGAHDETSPPREAAPSR